MFIDNVSMICLFKDNNYFYTYCELFENNKKSTTAAVVVYIQLVF